MAVGMRDVSETYRPQLVLHEFASHDSQETSQITERRRRVEEGELIFFPERLRII
jgi:hypothetical protein